MARPATVFICSACGASAPKWHGRCPGCGEWNSLVEERAPAARAARGAATPRTGARPVA
ncbi:MAG: DNA repair protein RadA, partial [Actinomycetota bacterium]|nr:DNA repair protein RadA [Actinomycetota bacterium]